MHSAAAIAAFVTAGARAIVSASMAPGKTTTAEMDALLDARRRGVLVVFSSCAGSGRMPARSPFVSASSLRRPRRREKSRDGYTGPMYKGRVFVQCL